MGNAKNSPGGYGRTICSQLCSQFALSGQCAHRGAIGSCSGWMVGYSSIATIGLRPPPDNVGRQKGCKVWIASDPTAMRDVIVSANSRIRLITECIGDITSIEKRQHGSRTYF